jgi:membrane protein
MAAPAAPFEQGRNRANVRPWDIPYAEWREIARVVWAKLQTHDLSFVAAGVAFFALLALFPALGAVVGVYGLIADPADVEQGLGPLWRVLPQTARSLVSGQLHQIASHAAGTLTFGVLLSLGLALWTASRGTSSLITALNIAYERPERRNYFNLARLSLALTAVGILFAVAALFLIVGLPAFFDLFGIGSLVAALLNLLTWPLLGLGFMTGLGVVYYFGPCRVRPQWQWITPGALFAAVLWLFGSGLFSLYVAGFGSYNEIYGSVGAAVVLLTWVYLSAYVVLLGAEVNAEVECRARTATQGGNGEDPARLEP